MVLISEIIQRIQSAYSKGVQSKDTRLTDRHIYSAALTARGTLIEQQANKTQYINDWVYQTLPYVRLEKAPITGVNVPKSKVILKSVNPLPKLVSNISKRLIRSVTSLDGSISFSSTTFSLNKYNKGNKYTGDKSKVYVRNKYLYLTVLTQLEAISIDAIFEDPIEVYQFNLDNDPNPCDDCKCKSAYDIEFPIDRDLLGAVVRLAEPELISLFSQMTEDTTNNAIDDNSTKNIIHQPEQ